MLNHRSLELNNNQIIWMVFDSITNENWKTESMFTVIWKNYKINIEESILPP